MAFAPKPGPAAFQARTRSPSRYVKRFGLKLEPFYPEQGGRVFVWRDRRAAVPFGHDPDVSQFHINFTAKEREAGFGGLEKLYLDSLQAQIRALSPDAWPLSKLSAYYQFSLKDYLQSQGASSDAIAHLAQGFEDDSLLDYVHDSISHAAPQLWKIRGGNDLLPKAMAERLQANLRYGAEVVRIEQTATGVQVKFQAASGLQETAGDYLICTLPFTVLRGIEVHPAWSDHKARAIHGVYMGPVARVFVQTQQRFWEAQGLNGFATIDRPMEIWSPTHNQPGRRGIVMSYCYERMALEYAGLSSKKEFAACWSSSRKCIRACKIRSRPQPLGRGPMKDTLAVRIW